MHVDSGFLHLAGDCLSFQKGLSFIPSLAHETFIYVRVTLLCHLLAMWIWGRKLLFLSLLIDKMHLVYSLISQINTSCSVNHGPGYSPLVLQYGNALEASREVTVLGARSHGTAGFSDFCRQQQLSLSSLTMHLSVRL